MKEKEILLENEKGTWWQRIWNKISDLFEDFDDDDDSDFELNSEPQKED